MKIEETALVLFEAARTEWGAHGKPVPPHQMEQILLLSQAESLKRIADTLDDRLGRTADVLNNWTWQGTLATTPFTGGN